MNRSKRRWVVFVVSLAAAAALSLPAVANADLTVNSSADHAPDGLCGNPSDCTLRDAIGLANSFPASHTTIDFAAGLDTIALTQGQIAITDNFLTIQGPGADVLAVNANGASRIFDITTLLQDVTISGLTLTGGNVTGDGGAIRTDSNTLTVERSTFTGNDATGDGGAISANDVILTVRGSTFNGNTADVAGGAISAVLTKLTMDNTTISGNSAQNGASGSGGGINYQSTFSSDVVEITNSTISNNTADDNGGGISSFPNASAPDPVLRNTIVANNEASFPGVDMFGPVAASFSLIEIDPGTLTTSVPGSNILGQDPKLGTLVNNSGPTATRKPAASSPVVDAGSTSATNDQRGQARPFDAIHIANSGTAGADGADMGAVELTFTETGSKRCGGKVATIIATKRKVRGTNGADVIVGTGGANVIRGRGGKDVICGLGGRDRLIGGGGRDILIGGAGGDTLIGGAGRDKLKGGPGRDTQVQ